MAFLWLKNILRPTLKKYTPPTLSISSNYKGDPDFDGTDLIVNISVNAIWIKHGALAGLGSIVTYPTFGQTIKHCWSEVQTNKGVYCVQFHGGANSLLIHKKNSIEDVIKEAKIVGGMDEADDKQIYCLYPMKSVKGNKRMEDLKLFVQSYANVGKYDLVLNNCQDLSSALYLWCN